MNDTPTAIFPSVPEPPPVFVDPSGRRRQRLRWLAYIFGLAGVAFVMMVGVSFAGGPVSPETVLPFVDAPQQQWQPPPALPLTPQPEATAPGSDQSEDRTTAPRARAPRPVPTTSRVSDRPDRTATPAESQAPAAPAAPTPTPEPTQVTPFRLRELGL